MSAAHRTEAGFLKRLALCVFVFCAFTGYSGFFVTRVSGTLDSAVTFSFSAASDRDRAAHFDLERFGVQRLEGNGNWTPVWSVSQIPHVMNMKYGDLAGGKEVVKAQPLQPGFTYRSYSSAQSDGPILYSNASFRISGDGKVTAP
jgi:hypothetical protein